MDRLIKLYNIASPSGKERRMAQHILSELDSMGVCHSLDRKGNIYAVKGRAKTYPCVVAHMDEVHRHKTGTYGAYVVNGSMIIGYDHKNRSMVGIGADDKNGIWICLNMLERFKVMKCVFFVQEEVGCIGSGHADMGFFSNCRFVIQCDRKGNRDMVTRINMTGLCSDEFIRKIRAEQYGYAETSGLATDVHMLKRRGLDVSCINLSCGYYNPHTDSEYTIWEDISNCFRFVCHIVRTHREVSPHLPQEPASPEYGWFMDDDDGMLPDKFYRKWADRYRKRETGF